MTYREIVLSKMLRDIWPRWAVNIEDVPDKRIKICFPVMDQEGDCTVEKNSIDRLDKAFRPVILSAG